MGTKTRHPCTIGASRNAPHCIPCIVPSISGSVPGVNSPLNWMSFPPSPLRTIDFSSRRCSPCPLQVWSRMVRRLHAYQITCQGWGKGCWDLLACLSSQTYQSDTSFHSPSHQLVLNKCEDKRPPPLIKLIYTKWNSLWHDSLHDHVLQGMLVLTHGGQSVCSKPIMMVLF